MKIGELAAHAQCDVQTVRYYEREGLLAPPARDAAGYRHYTAPHLERLCFIRHCRSLDISLAEIRQLLAYSDAPSGNCHEVNALIDDHIARVRQRQRALRSLERQLVVLRSACRGAGEARSCAILDNFLEAAAEAAAA